MTASRAVGPSKPSLVAAHFGRACGVLCSGRTRRISAADGTRAQNRHRSCARDSPASFGLATPAASSSADCWRAMPSFGTPGRLVRLRSRSRARARLSRPGNDAALYPRRSISAAVEWRKGSLGRPAGVRRADSDSRAPARWEMVARLRRRAWATVRGDASLTGDGKPRCRLASISQSYACSGARVLRVPDRRHELQQRRRLSRRALTQSAVPD